MKQISIFIFLFSSITIFGQNSESKNFTGILSFDSKLVSEITAQEFEPDGETISVNKKSPLLAGVLSFALPGAGEFYSKIILSRLSFLQSKPPQLLPQLFTITKGMIKQVCLKIMLTLIGMFRSMLTGLLITR